MKKALILVMWLGVFSLAVAGDRELIKKAMEAGHWAEAETLLQKVLTAHPDNATAHYWLAITKEKEGDIAQAKEQLATARSIDPQEYFSGNKTWLAEMDARLNRTVTTQELSSKPEIQPDEAGNRLTAGGSFVDEVATPAVDMAVKALPYFVAISAAIWLLISLRGKGGGAAADSERAELKRELVLLRGSLKDAQQSMEARADLKPEEKYALHEQARLVLVGLSEAEYAVTNSKDFSSAYAILDRGNKVLDEIQAYGKPAATLPRLASKAVPASVSSGPLSPQVVEHERSDSWLFTGVLLGSMLSNDRPRESHRTESSWADTKDDNRVDDRASVDVGGGSSSEDWSSSGSSFDSGGSSSSDSW